MAEATFAAGCFWGVEAVFRMEPGVGDARVGYTGGETASPTYEQVCSGATGHAEAVKIVYDPSVVSYRQLLDVFFGVHDARQVNRQGPDIGTQYRSAIFYHDAEQEQAARDAIAAFDEVLPEGEAIATQLVAAEDFWPAEEYHQQYIAKQRARG